MKLLGIAGALALGVAASAAAQEQGAVELPPVDGPAYAPFGSETMPVHGADNPGDPASEIETLFMGRELISRNVTYPTLTPVFPVSGRANGAAVIVAPGGGYMFVSMQNEGWRVAQALADKGYTAFVLKYRTRPTPLDEGEFMQAMRKMFDAAQSGEGERPALKHQPAVDDALAALALVRARADAWNIDPERVGFIGFSAGARTGLDAVLQGGKELGPAFFGHIYGPMEAEKVPEGAAPMFAAIAYDDPLFDTSRFPLATAWYEAGRPVELHVYGGGGHGFGLGHKGTTSAGMIGQFIAWADMLGFDKSKDEK